MQISIVIPMYEAAGTIGRTLSSLQEFFRAGDEVLVIDDRSRDAGPGIAGRQPARVHVLPAHSGPAAARNRGARLAANPWLLFLDADVVCPPGIRERLVNCFRKQEAVQGVYAPLSQDENAVTKYQNNYYHHVFQRVSGTGAAVCATFCFGIRKELFLQAGGFDEGITDPTVEDEDMGYTLHDQGHEILLCPDLQVGHLARYTLRGFVVRRFRMARRQASRFLKRGGMAGVFRFLALNRSGKTHHPPVFLLAVALLPCVYGLLLLGLACGSAIAAVPVFACLGAVFALNAPLLRALIRLSGNRGTGMPLVFFLDLHILFAGVACGLLQRGRGAQRSAAQPSSHGNRL